MPKIFLANYLALKLYLVFMLFLKIFVLRIHSKWSHGIINCDLINQFYKRYIQMQAQIGTQAQTKIRKDLRTLSDGQMKHYFFLYKLLRIFAPEKKILNVEDYQFRAQITDDDTDFILVTPTCYYDILISIHCNCCQHRSQFFPYWHRWLVGKFQQFLHQVEDKISSKDTSWIQIETQRLFAIASKNTIYPQPKKPAIQNCLKQIKKSYDILSTNWHDKAAAHYWNVFDNTQEINYPKQFTQKISGLQDLDKLIQIIWDENGLLQFNFKTRWYGNQIKKALDYQKGYLKTNNFQLTPTAKQIQKLIDNNKFWQDPDKNPQSKSRQQLRSLFSKNLQETNYFNNKTTLAQLHTLIPHHKIKHNVFGIKDINLLFGGKGRSFYKQQGDLKKLRNQIIPYFQYGYALKTKPEDFMNLFCTTSTNATTSMETPHNFMHNNLGSMMNDANFSVINPIFFAYHSFIDLMLEIKIQWINAEFRPWQGTNIHSGDKQKGYNSAVTFMESEFKSKGMQGKFQDQWKKYQQNYDPTIKVFSRQYPILSYINPNWQNWRDITNDFGTQFIIGQKTYENLIIDNVKKQLKDLQTASSSTYDLRYDDVNNKLIHQLIEVAKIVPNKDEKLFVNIEMKYPSSIKSCNSIIVIKDSEKKFIDLAPIGIFSKGLAAESCPNCPKFHVQNIYFPIPTTQSQSFISKTSKTISLKSNRSEVHIYPQHDAKSNIYPQINHQQVLLRVKTGRKVIDISIGKNSLQSQFKRQISLSFIGQVPFLEKNNIKIKAFISNQQNHDVSSSEDVQFRMNADGQGKIITQIMGCYTHNNQKIPFRYKFPMYSDYAKFKINVDALSKINQQSSMEARAACLQEISLGFTHPSQLPSLREISIPLDNQVQ